MIAIKNFAYGLAENDIPVCKLETGTVREFIDLTSQFHDKSMVVSLPGGVVPAVVTPLRAKLIENLGLRDDQELLGTGAWDLLRAGQVAIESQQNAVDVVRRIEAMPQDVDWVVLYEGSSPSGILCPAALPGAIGGAGAIRGSDLATRSMTADWNAGLPDYVSEIESQFPNFQIDNLAANRVPLFECADHGRPHPVRYRPCPSHPTSITTPIDLLLGRDRILRLGRLP